MLIISHAGTVKSKRQSVTLIIFKSLSRFINRKMIQIIVIVSGIFIAVPLSCYIYRAIRSLVTRRRSRPQYQAQDSETLLDQLARHTSESQDIDLVCEDSFLAALRLCALGALRNAENSPERCDTKNALYISSVSTAVQSTSLNFGASNAYPSPKRNIHRKCSTSSSLRRRRSSNSITNNCPQKVELPSTKCNPPLI